MKYLILVPDGMADESCPALGGKTPMEVAKKPYMDALASAGKVGTVSNVPAGMVPESDTANMAIMSFDPKIYSKGRSPLEAVSMGLVMKPNETAYRMNLVSLSEEEDTYEDRIMLDHSSDEISTAEADILVKDIEKHFGTDLRHFYTGISYRHCLLWQDSDDKYPFNRPHDILGQCIREYLPKEENGGAEFLRLMKESYDFLVNHPVNVARRAKGLKAANSVWLWSPGKKPALPNFREKWGLSATVISAVDLIKGIGICAGMKTVDVPGATGNLHTNYEGKADAAIKAFKNGDDLVYVHVEAPDECGHQGKPEDKVLSIEYIDNLILGPVWEYLKGCGDDFRILLLPDHPTPIVKRTHTIDPVPYILFDSAVRADSGITVFTEATAREKNDYLANGYALMEKLTSH